MGRGGGDGDFDKYKRGRRPYSESDVEWNERVEKSFDGLQNLGIQWMFKQQQT